jgi:hypothetical protein
MKLGALLATGRGRYYSLMMLASLTLAGCRTCPMDSCHVRKAHLHNGVKYRARPIWKMQYPAIGERIKVQKEGDGKRKDGDRSRHLK